MATYNTEADEQNNIKETRKLQKREMSRKERVKKTGKIKMITESKRFETLRKRKIKIKIYETSN